MTYSFHPEARAEFKEATIYYSEKNPSMASAFYTEVENAIEKIVENPNLFRVYATLRETMKGKEYYKMMYVPHIPHNLHIRVLYR